MSRIVAGLHVDDMPEIALDVNTQTESPLDPAYGIRGKTPSFTIGTVSTLSPGESATATITGTDEDPILNLGIPQGMQGESGRDGQDGRDGNDGQTGATGATPNLTIGTVSTLSEGASATATITGTAENPILNLGIPVGATGAAGQDGHDGQTGQTGATPNLIIGEVTTVEAGGSATASITGTAEAPILNLGIPQGAAGQNGTTPVKGTDYWTTADKGEIINAAVAATLAAYPAAESELF